MMHYTSPISSPLSRPTSETPSLDHTAIHRPLQRTRHGWTSLQVKQSRLEDYRRPWLNRRRRLLVERRAQLGATGWGRETDMTWLAGRRWYGERFCSGVRTSLDLTLGPDSSFHPLPSPEQNIVVPLISTYPSIIPTPPPLLSGADKASLVPWQPLLPLPMQPDGSPELTRRTPNHHSSTRTHPELQRPLYGRLAQECQLCSCEIWQVAGGAEGRQGQVRNGHWTLDQSQREDVRR